MSGLPIVSDADRAWAMSQCPPWARCYGVDDPDEGEIVDDGGWLDRDETFENQKIPNWADFVHEQAERFEKFFTDEYYAGKCKPNSDWSALWRKGWWPKADPYKRWPKMAKKEFHPFFRRGSQEFSRALTVATPQERKLWEQFGIAQFQPHDPRLPGVRGVKTSISDRITGDDR